MAQAVWRHVVGEAGLFGVAGEHRADAAGAVGLRAEEAARQAEETKERGGPGKPETYKRPLHEDKD